MTKFDSVERQEIFIKSQECLWDAEGKPGLDYLTNIRKLSHDVIRKFKLGYLPYNLEHKLAGRLIFPIEDPSGNLIALSSRLISAGKNNLPIYWHESYEKGFYLYGMFYAKEFLRKWKFCLVTEGQIDVMQMHNYGFTNTVGLCCDKMSSVQISTIYRYCDEIILILDTDSNRAGQRGRQKIMQEFSKNNKHSIYRDKIGFIEFQENLDPDEFLLKFGQLPMRKLIKSKLKELRNDN